MSIRANTTSAAEPDTIAAIATPPGVGGIGIVRISGPQAFAIGHALFHPASTTDGATSSHLLTYGYVRDPATNELVDEVLAVFMRAPRTYTCEDVVELQAHGAPLTVRRILELALRAGARTAQPGELTLRAFLNGRIDLAQAEAVLALINAESDAGRRLALRQLQGELSARVRLARAAALEALVRIEASIDFPDEEVPPPDPEELARFIAQAQVEVAALLAGAERGRLLREGLRVTLVGRPNVGKSSLLNALLRSERAIVTPIAGTTRDTIEERMLLHGVALHLVDTAGLTPTDEPVERLGVERARTAAREADLLLLTLDASEPLTELDWRAAEDVRRLWPEGDAPPVVIALNKADLPARFDAAEALQLWPNATVVQTSTVTPEGVAALEQRISALVQGGEAVAADALVSAARQSDALRRAEQQLRAAQMTLTNGAPLDFVSIDLQAALDALGEITGESATADLLDRIFAEFCIGK